MQASLTLRPHNYLVNTKMASDWVEINKYLMGNKEIRTSICFGCGKGIIYDREGNKIIVSRKNTLDEVKQIVEKITK